MIFAWLRRRRRRKILSQPFPETWRALLEQNVWHYSSLTADEQQKLCDDLRIFLAEKYWEGCGGLQINDEIKVTISALACLLVLAVEHNFYRQVQSILVYPTKYAVPNSRPNEAGLVTMEPQGRLGEAWYRGPVILSWDDVLAGAQGQGSGQNVVLHEFAHVLDMQDRVLDGTPPLRDASEYRQWQQVMSAEYRRLVRSSLRGQATLLDQYGATNESEFFAVATECFFERGAPLRLRHPELYATLKDYYRQDPAARRRADARF